MWNWFLRLIGKAPIPTHAEILAPLQKHLDSLVEANEARQEVIKANKARIASLADDNIRQSHEMAANSVTIGKLQEIL